MLASKLASSLRIFLFTAILSFPAFAHHVPDVRLGVPQAPAASAPIETVTGTVRTLVVDNRITGQTIRQVALQLDDGRKLVLNGTGLDALEQNASVQASGQRSGDVLFVTGYHVVAATASAAATAKVEAQVQGMLAIVHADNFDQGRSSYNFVVLGDDGHATPLQLAVMPSSLEIGMRVVATGTMAGDGFSLEADHITILAAAPPKPGANDVSPAPITNNVLVVLIKFPGTTEAFSQAQVDQVTRTNSDSVANYYQEVSYGKQLLNVTVTPWLLSATAAPATCDYTAIGSAGDAAASAAGYNLASYQNHFYVFPSRGDCGWAGLAYVGFPLYAWSNGYNQLGVYGHELGHNFGLLHAASLTCTGQVIGGSCTADEYGDPFDVMGNISAMHFNAAQKSILNWLPAGSVSTHPGGSATYTLSPLESAGAATYAVKVPTTANRTYWIEFRQPIGFDGGMSSYPNNGAQIRVSSPFEWLCGGCADNTELLDLTPATAGSFGDAALLAGRSYTDTANNITMSVLSASPTALSVQISAGSGPTASTTTLASSLNPSVVGMSVTFTATVTGSSPTGTVSFTDGGSSISGCTASTLSGSGNTRTAQCATSSLSAGTHSIVAAYSGDGGNTGSASTPLSQIVNSSASSSLINGSFEIPVMGSGYQYNPSAAGIGWSFSTNSGIEGNGSAWGAASAPLGTQAAFIQGAATIAQTVNMNAGTYTISFQAAQRSCCAPPYVQPIKVSVDGIQIGSLISPSSTAFSSFSIPFSISVSGPHGITFAGTDPTDKTTFIDNVTLVSNTSITASATTLASSLNPSVVGMSVTFTATVTGSSPTGTVNFTDGGSSISGCSASILSGSGNSKTAQCATSSLSAGTHSIVAAYAGDAGNTGSGSVPLSQVVNSSASSSLINGSFEIPALVNGYQYNPSAPGIGWTFSASGSGIEGNGSAWSAASAPNGTQAAFIQNTGSISQTISLNAGSYTIAFQAAQRSYACCVSPYVQPIKVSVDGTQIGSLVSPPSTAYSSFSITFSVSSTGSHTITLAGTDGSGDKTSFIDNVTLVTTASLINGSFEIPALGSGYQYNPSAPGMGWTFSSFGSGIEGNGSPWSAAAAPDGTQAAFIQSTGSFTQSVSLNAGSYTISFLAAQRPCCALPLGQPLKVSVDGTQIGGLISPPSTAFSSFSIPFSVSSSGSHTITFAGTDGSRDNSTFIDNVTLH